MDAAVAVPPRAIDLGTEHPFRVGGASIDPASRDAAFNGTVERLQPQNLKVLVALARQRGKVVSRDELVDLCWDGRFVGDDVINRAISTLRQFAERAGGFSIETVPRSGYRLVERSPSMKWGQRVIAAVALILLALAAITFLEWPRRGTVRPMPTIAVLPFTTASADPQERELASNARDAVANMLSQTRYRIALSIPRSKRTAPDFVVSANVGSNPQTMFVTVRVEDTAHNAIVYSNRFEADRRNAGNLPDRIGGQIAGSLGWTASLLMLEKSHPSEPAITAELFGQVNNYQLARQIAARAPNSAIAQNALAFSATDAMWDLPRDQHVQALEVGRRAMDQVRVLAPGFGGTDVLWCYLHSRVRLIECEDHLRAGIRNDPDSPWVEDYLANWLKDVGRTSEALDFARNSLAHDPFVAGKIELTLRMLEATGRQDEAEELYRDSRRWWPDDQMIFSGLVYGAMDRGDFETIARSKREIEKTRLAPLLAPGLPVLAAIQANDVAKARELCPVDQTASFKRDLCLLALARLGDNDDAFALALRTYPNRVGRTPAEEDRLWLDTSRYGETDILMGPAAAPLRRDPRFLEITRRLGLLTYWRSGRLPDFCNPPHPEPICAQLRPH
ncbi:MAG: winged helix-turn-helix domain-containing protein [Sphingomicrobium sp.]